MFLLSALQSAHAQKFGVSHVQDFYYEYFVCCRKTLICLGIYKIETTGFVVKIQKLEDQFTTICEKLTYSSTSNKCPNHEYFVKPLLSESVDMPIQPVIQKFKIF